jgi:hypothetical protein
VWWFFSRFGSWFHLPRAQVRLCSVSAPVHSARSRAPRILSPSSSDFHFVFFFRFVSWCLCWFSRNSKFWSLFSVQRSWFFLLEFLELCCCFSTAAQDFSFAAAGQVCSLLEFSTENFVFPEPARRRHLISRASCTFAAAGQVCSLLEFSTEDFVFPEPAGRRHLISWVHLFPTSKEVTAPGVFVDLSPARPFSR